MKEKADKRQPFLESAMPGGVHLPRKSFSFLLPKGQWKFMGVQGLSDDSTRHTRAAFSAQRKRKMVQVQCSTFMQIFQLSFYRLRELHIRRYELSRGKTVRTIQSGERLTQRSRKTDPMDPTPC